MQPFFELARDENPLFCCSRMRNNSCNPHYHSNIEIAYVTEGEFEATVSGRTALLKPGDLSVASSYEVHNYRTPDKSEIVLLIIPTALVGLFTNMTQHAVFRDPFLISSSKTDVIRDALTKLETYDQTEGTMVVKGYLYVILGTLLEQLGLKEYTHSVGEPGKVRDVLMYIEAHYLEPLTTTTLAEHFGYNRFYFSRLFNSTLGCGFNHYVNTLRARHAALLIHNSTLSLTEISYASGFNNTRTFARAFSSLYGISALDYKKSHVPLSDMDNDKVKFEKMKKGLGSPERG